MYGAIEPFAVPTIGDASDSTIHSDASVLTFWSAAANTGEPRRLSGAGGDCRGCHGASRRAARSRDRGRVVDEREAGVARCHRATSISTTPLSSVIAGAPAFSISGSASRAGRSTPSPSPCRRRGSRPCRLGRLGHARRGPSAPTGDRAERRHPDRSRTALGERAQVLCARETCGATSAARARCAGSGRTLIPDHARSAVGRARSARSRLGNASATGSRAEPPSARAPSACASPSLPVAEVQGGRDAAVARTPRHARVRAWCVVMIGRDRAVVPAADGGRRGDVRASTWSILSGPLGRGVGIDMGGDRDEPRSRRARRRRDRGAACLTLPQRALDELRSCCRRDSGGRATAVASPPLRSYRAPRRRRGFDWFSGNRGPAPRGKSRAPGRARRGRAARPRPRAALVERVALGGRHRRSRRARRGDAPCAPCVRGCARSRSSHGRSRRGSRSAVELPPGRDERLLGDVLAEHVIAGRAVGHRAYEVLVARDELAEGLVLAAPAGLHQLAIGFLRRSFPCRRLCTSGAAQT